LGIDSSRMSECIISMLNIPSQLPLAPLEKYQGRFCIDGFGLAGAVTVTDNIHQKNEGTSIGPENVSESKMLTMMY
jgi:hypothetical protein